MIANSMTLLRGLLLFLLTAGASAQITVTSLADSGPGTLRQAIFDANAVPGFSAIHLDSGLKGTIQIQTPLPTISQDLAIQGTLDPALQASRVAISGANNVKILTSNDAELTLSALRFQNGDSFGDGGAVEFSSSNNQHTLRLMSCEFANNTANSGGAVLVSGGDLQGLDSSFHGNRADLGGFARGGAIAFRHPGPALSTCALQSCSFIANTAGQGRGGAVSVEGEGIKFSMIKCRFEHNSSRDGGALNMGLSGTPNLDYLSVDRCLFRHNSAIDRGGAIYYHSTPGTATLNMLSSTLTQNSSSAGGGLYLEGVDIAYLVVSTFDHLSASGQSQFPSAGAGYFTGCDVRVNSCTVVENTAAGGFGLPASVGGFDVVGGDLSVGRTVFDGNGLAIRLSGGSLVDNDYNLINDASSIPGAGFSAANNLISVPSGLGVLVESCDWVGSTWASTVQPVCYPTLGSPLIDAGDSFGDYDQIGTFRPIGAANDIGAIEGLRPNAEIDILDGAGSIADGGSDALGNQVIGTRRTLTYRVECSPGTPDLCVTGVKMSAPNNIAQFTAGSIFPLDVPAGGSAQLVVHYEVVAAGPFSFDLEILNTDIDESSYDIAVSGSGILTTQGSVGMNDYTLNGMGSGTRSCTALSFANPVPHLTARVESSGPGLAVAILFRSTACSPQSQMVASCNQTTFDLVYSPSIVKLMGMTDATGVFSQTYPVGNIPFTLTFSTQALIAHPCGPLFTQAFDVTIQ